MPESEYNMSYVTHVERTGVTLSSALVVAEVKDKATVAFPIHDTDNNLRGMGIRFVGDKWQTPKDRIAERGSVAPSIIH